MITEDYFNTEYMKLRDEGLLPLMKMEDGFSMSVQASSFHYCSPRDNEGPYERVEVGFPSQFEPLLAFYKEWDGDYAFSHSLFPYTPLSVVVNVVNKHGGLKEPIL